MTMNKYFQLVTNGATADLDIYGDIAESWWDSKATDAYSLSKQLEQLSGVQQINVHINSYGGEVAEGLAIYNALRRHSAKIRTTCDGFACSIASVVFMAGDERVMADASLLMIHNAWTSTFGANSADLRKLADDMDIITQASKNAYLSRVTIDEAELSALMDAESWITPQDAISMGFATEIESFGESENPSQNARQSLMSIVGDAIAQKAAGDATDDDDEADDEPKTDTDGDDTSGEETDGDPDDSDEDDSDEDEASTASESAKRLGAFLSAITTPDTIIIH